MLSGILITFAESTSEAAGIKNIFDGVWWAIVTVSTVGYGDLVPVTLLGKSIGMILILFGTVTYSSMVLFIGLTLKESQEFFQYKRVIDRLEEIDKKMDEIRKKQDHLILKKSSKK
jgi:voltage-gated potassium channel Kch